MRTHDAEAMIVLSGGQDSVTCLFWAARCFRGIRAVTVDYGQRHNRELEAAEITARMAGVLSHDFVRLPPSALVSISPLTSEAKLEKYENASQMADVIGNRIELTFVPMRNTMLMTIAMNRALHYGIKDLVTGVCQEDGANYPDCRNSFITSLTHTFRLSMDDQSIFIHAPLMNYSKAETVRLALSMPGCMPALAYSHTSYDGKYPPTDMNHANVLRASGFEQAGVADPLVLRAVTEGLMELPLSPNYDSFRVSLNK